MDTVSYVDGRHRSPRQDLQITRPARCHNRRVAQAMKAVAPIHQIA